jgi:hypothetical protein
MWIFIFSYSGQGPAPGGGLQPALTGKENMLMINLLSFKEKMISSPAKQSCKFSRAAGWPEGHFSLEIIFL